MENVGFQALFNAAFGLLTIAVGGVVGALWQAVRGLQADDKEITKRIASVEVLIAGDYVKRDDYRADLRALNDTLQRIEEKIDGKADK